MTTKKQVRVSNNEKQKLLKERRNKAGLFSYTAWLSKKSIEIVKKLAEMDKEERLTDERVGK